MRMDKTCGIPGIGGEDKRVVATPDPDKEWVQHGSPGRAIGTNPLPVASKKAKVLPEGQ